MSKIYLSYRRMDAAAYAGRLFDYLSRHFGHGSMFMDIGGISGGQDFAQVIESELNACDVVLVLIGSTWATSTGQDGRRRLDDPEDWVRLEVAAALRRNVLVVPVLVEGVQIPDPASLPEELRPLCRRNARELSDLRWSYDVGELVKDLERVFRPSKGLDVPRATKDKKLRWLAGSAIVLALLLGMALFGPPAFHINPSGPSNSTTPTLNSIETKASQVQAGHLIYKLLKADISRYAVGPDGQPSKWALRCSIRITDVTGLTATVDSDNFRLMADGVELPPENKIWNSVDVKGTVDTDALFIIPADVDRVELIVGRSKDATAKIPIQTSLLSKPVAQASTGSEVQAGHLIYKLLKADISRYAVDPDGKPSKWALQCSIRITDVMGLTATVDSDNFRLMADGVELPPENKIWNSVDVKGTVDTDALFIIPADVDRVELIVGRSKDATAKIPIQTSLLSKPVAQASTGSEVQAGHLIYKLLKTNLKQYSVDPDGKPSKWALQCSIRITDVMGLTATVDSDNLRLMADGVELPPENKIWNSVDVKGTVDTDALFIIPADVDRVELIVGRSKDATAKIPIQTSLLSKPVAQASTGSEVQAGHLIYKLLKTNLKQYSVDPDGKPSKWALRCSIRITDVMGLAATVDSDNFRLTADGVELPPENKIWNSVDVKGTVDTDALFIIPANVDRVELIVGRSKDATAKIPIQTSLLSKPVAQASTGSEVQAGHLIYKLLKADISRYAVGPDGQPSKWALQCSIRITDVMGLIATVDSDNFRLVADGVELPPENKIWNSVDVKGTVDTDALFITPADVDRVELIVGRSNDATAKIPIALRH